MKNEGLLPVLILSFLFLGGIPLSGEGSSSDGGAIPSRHEKSGKNINGDVYLKGDNGIEVFASWLDAPGNGSKEDPYLFEGWTFNGTGSCLRIEQTDVHLIITNCTFRSAKIWCRGIDLAYTTNIVIRESYFSGLYQGIGIYQSEAMVLRNTIHGMGGVGVKMEYSNCSVIGNHISDTYYGIRTDSSIGKIADNMMNDTEFFGMYIKGDHIIQGNKLLNSGFHVNEPIPENNTVNGRPIIVLKDISEANCTGNYSQVILVNCSQIRIHDMKFRNTTCGILSITGNCTVEGCSFVGCNYGIHTSDGIDVRRCAFADCDQAILSYTEGRTNFYQNTFDRNSNGIRVRGSYAISGNLFTDTDQNAIMVETSHSESTESYITGNYITGAYHGIYLSDSRANIHNLTWNIIQKADVGIKLVAGKTVLNTNQIEGCVNSSIYCNDLMELYGNILKDTGIDYVAGSISGDPHNTLNGWPIIIIFEKNNIKIKEKCSQIIIYDSHNIDISDLDLSARPFGVAARYSYMISLKNNSMLRLKSMHCSLLMNDNNVTVFDDDWSSIYARHNNFLTHLEIKRNGSDFDENYYFDYHENREFCRTSDGIHWVDPYVINEKNEDKNPLVFPWNYKGSKNPVIKDKTMDPVHGGSPFNFSLEAWDINAVRGIDLEIDIGYDHDTLRMVHLTGDNWTVNYTAPDNITSLRYSIHAESVAGIWTNTSLRTIRVMDVIAPSLIDHSDQFGTTGDPFGFKVKAIDNIGISKVWVDTWRQGSIRTSIEMDFSEEDGEYYTTMVLPTYRIDTLYYVINALDLQGNNVTSGTITTEVQDNDRPVPVVTLVINTYTGINTTFDGSKCTDNIAIVVFHWDIYDVEGVVKTDGIKTIHIFQYPGIYMVILMIKDAANNAEWAVFYVNVSEAPVPPPLPEEVLMNLVVGKVLDNDTGLPLEGVRILLQVSSEVYYNTTDKEGYGTFVIPKSEDMRKASMTLKKEGFRNLSFVTMIMPNGKLSDPVPKMIRIGSGTIEPPKDLPSDETKGGKDSDLWLFISIGMISILALIASSLWIYIIRYSRRSIGEE